MSIIGDFSFQFCKSFSFNIMDFHFYNVTIEISNFNNEGEANEENDFEISTMNTNSRQFEQTQPKMVPKQKRQVQNPIMQTPINSSHNFPINSVPNFPMNSGVHQNMYPGIYDPKSMMTNIEGQTMSGPQYMISPGANTLSSYNFAYQPAPGYVIHPMSAQIPPTQNMPQ